MLRRFETGQPDPLTVFVPSHMVDYLRVIIRVLETCRGSLYPVDCVYRRSALRGVGMFFVMLMNLISDGARSMIFKPKSSAFGCFKDRRSLCSTPANSEVLYLNSAHIYPCKVALPLNFRPRFRKM